MENTYFINSCCSLDLETDKDGKIFAIGAVFNDKIFHRQAPFSIFKVLHELDDFAEKADYILGHNVLAHDLVVLKSIAPKLHLFQKSVIDTLLLSPLAFPENPYHYLVKDYKLVRSSINDPLADARLTLSLFSDQWDALQQQHADCGILSFIIMFSANIQACKPCFWQWGLKFLARQKSLTASSG